MKRKPDDSSRNLPEKFLYVCSHEINLAIEGSECSKHDLNIAVQPLPRSALIAFLFAKFSVEFH